MKASVCVCVCVFVYTYIYIYKVVNNRTVTSNRDVHTGDD